MCRDQYSLPLGCRIVSCPIPSACQPAPMPCITTSSDLPRTPRVLVNLCLFSSSTVAPGLYDLSRILLSRKRHMTLLQLRLQRIYFLMQFCDLIQIFLRMCLCGKSQCYWRTIVNTSAIQQWEKWTNLSAGIHSLASRTRAYVALNSDVLPSRNARLRDHQDQCRSVRVDCWLGRRRRSMHRRFGRGWTLLDCP